MNRLVALSSLLVAAACASSRSSERPPAPAGMHATAPAPAHAAGMPSICPTDVPDTTLKAEDTADGEALTFTTTSGQVDELRRRVHAMADMHNAHHGGATAAAVPPGQADVAAAGHGGPSATPHPGAPGAMGMPPPSRAAVTDVDAGARLQVTPTDPADAPRLRQSIRAHAEQMQRGGCGMMHGS